VPATGSQTTPIPDTSRKTRPLSSISSLESRTPNAAAVKRPTRAIAATVPSHADSRSRTPSAAARQAAATTSVPSRPAGASANTLGSVAIITGACLPSRQTIKLVYPIERIGW